MTRDKRLRAVADALTRPEVRAAFEVHKQLYAVASAKPAESVDHQLDAMAASVQLGLVIDMIDEARSLPREAVYRYLVTIALGELWPADSGMTPPTLKVRIGAGRPPGARTGGAREELIRMVRADPTMETMEINRLGVALGWWDDLLDGDYPAIKRRVKGIRKQANE